MEYKEHDIYYYVNEGSREIFRIMHNDCGKMSVEAFTTSPINKIMGCDIKNDGHSKGLCIECEHHSGTSQAVATFGGTTIKQHRCSAFYDRVDGSPRKCSEVRNDTNCWKFKTKE